MLTDKFHCLHRLCKADNLRFGQGLPQNRQAAGEDDGFVVYQKDVRSLNGFLICGKQVGGVHTQRLGKLRDRGGVGYAAARLPV